MPTSSVDYHHTTEDVGIAHQIKPSVPGKQLQHVVQKAASGVDFVAAGAVQIKGQLDLGLVGVAFQRYHALCHCHTSSILSTVSISACICSGVPMVIRSQFSVRGASKCRTRMPFCFNAL